MYQIGKLLYPEKDDPEIADYWDAIKKAQELSIDDSIYGVWTSQGENSDLLAIIYQGEVFQN